MINNKYYEEINKAIKQYEKHKPYYKTIDWICNRIDWCWKWRKITKEEMEDFVDRICAVMGSGVDV